MTTVPSPGSPSFTRRCPFDPPASYLALRDRGELGRVVFPDGDTGWLVTSHDDVTAMLSDARFSSSVNAPPRLPDGRPTPGWFFGMDPPEQTRLRRLLTGKFTLRQARRLAPRIERIVAAQLDAVQRLGAPVDLFATFAWPLPGLVICDLLGLPPEQTRAVEDAVAVFDAADVTADQRVAAFHQLWEAMLHATVEKRHAAGDDVLSDMLQDTPVTVEEAASIAVALRLAGQAPVSHIIGLGLFVLLQEPARLAALRERPERIGAAVDELLRYLPTNNLGVIRVATEDVALGDGVVRAGDLVFASLPTANRDPTRFAEPHRLDLDRAGVPHLAFGHGPHKCLGQNLARVELEIVFGVLLERFPRLRLAVEPAAVPLFESESSYGVARLPVRW